MEEAAMAQASSQRGRASKSDERQPLLSSSAPIDARSNGLMFAAGVDATNGSVRAGPDGGQEIDHDGCFPPHRVSQPCPANPCRDLPVYDTIHKIRREVIAAIDDPYSIEQLRDPRMNISVLRPLVDQFYEDRDVSMIYCLLVNRAQFLREQLSQSHQQNVCTTRALLCEIIATRILRRFHEDNPGAHGLLLLAQILVGGFDPFQGAPESVMQESSHFAWTFTTTRGSQKGKLPALEIAIISESKTFLSSNACQKVVNAIYEGRVVYTPTTFIDILPDHYKQKPISLYNPRKAPLFNQYRLIVPRTRKYLEVFQFIILLVLFLLVMSDRNAASLGIVEIMFIIYTIGWTLDQIAAILEHGWHVYTQNLWSFLDVCFSSIFFIYLVLRIDGRRKHSLNTSQQALDVLAMGAPVLIPRLAFNLMTENMLFVSLRAMMRDFTVLTILAVWCFAGFLLSMTWLSDGEHGTITISKWMLWVWFGLDGTGIEKSVDFHWLLGPVLMIAFAFLGNTLFLTILVSMLSTTFSNIVSNATAEIQFRRAVLTLEGVKSDALFAYQPPFNIAALVILLPLKFIITPRWFHKINVAAQRTLNAPVLLIIGFVERRMLWSGHRRQTEAVAPQKALSRAGLWDLSRGWSVHGDISAVFDSRPPQEEDADSVTLEEEDVEMGNQQGEQGGATAVEIGNENEFERQFAQAARGNDSANDENGKNSMPRLRRTATARSRRDSVAPWMVSGGMKKLLDAGGDDDEDDEEGDMAGVSQRLEALERTTARIEKMLARLCDALDDGAERVMSPESGESVDIGALDKGITKNNVD